jgi:WD40 repeat protein
MGQIFISHSSYDNQDALALREWLSAQGWTDVFLDVDPVAGLAPGQRWRDELNRAGERCSAVLLLVSPHWIASKWCFAEFLFAAQLGKEIFPVMIAPCPYGEMPTELTATYQVVDISTSDSHVSGWERLRIGLLRAGLHPDAFPWPPKNEPHRTPYRGLRPLEEADAAIFFGRESQVTKALDSLRRLHDGAPERLLVILGASGAGKSSFLRAGVLPRLRRDSVRFLVLPTVRPGRAAMSGPLGLRHALGMTGAISVATIRERLAQLRSSQKDSATVASLAPAALAPTIVLPVDQAEELFAVGDVEAEETCRALKAAVEADSNCVLIFTLRADSFGTLQGHAALSAIPRTPFDLPRLPVSSFKEIIEGPTRLPGVKVTIERDLVEQLTQDFSGPDALPLLAFTLERLMLERGQRSSIGLDEYVNEMKGVGGAIRRAVEAAFLRASEAPTLPKSRSELDALARRCFVPWLVRVDDTSAPPKRRVALRRLLPQEGLGLMNCLVDERLLVADESGGEQTIEVSHEAVLRHWRELRNWIDERREDLRAAELVTSAAREWTSAPESSRSELLIHRGERLTHAEALLRWDDLKRQLGDDARAYLWACRDAERRTEAAERVRRSRQRRLRSLVTSVVAAGAVVTAGAGFLVIAGQRDLSRAKSLTLARAAMRLGEEGDYVRALRLSILAARSTWLAPSSPEGVAALASSAQGQQLVLEFRGHRGAVKGALFLADGEYVVTWSEDHTARVWDVKSGSEVATMTHGDAITGLTLSPDGRLLLSTSSDRTARLWEARTGTPVGGVMKHDAAVLGGEFSSDGHTIVTWSHDRTVRIWDASSGKSWAPPFMHDDAVIGAAFSNDDQLILTWSRDTTAAVWNASTGHRITRTARQSSSLVDGIEFGASLSPDQTKVITWNAEGSVRLWKSTTGAPVGILLKQERGDVDGATVSRDGQRVLTWGDSGPRLWDAQSGKLLGVPRPDDDVIRDAILSLRAGRIVPGDTGRTLRLWAAGGDGTNRELLRQSRDAIFSQDQSRILTWSVDGTARLWNADNREVIGGPFKHDRPVNGATLSPDEKLLLSWSDDGTARLWSTSGGRVGSPILHAGVLAYVTKDGRRIFTIGNNVGGWASGWSDLESGLPVTEPVMHPGLVAGAQLSAAADQFVTWDWDGNAQVWNVTTGEPIGQAFRPGKRVEDGTFFADDRRLLTWERDGAAYVWDTRSGQPIGEPMRHEGLQGVALSHDQSLVLTWNDGGSVRQWEAATGARLGVEFKHEKAVNGAIFDQHDKRVLTWSDDRIAQLWDTTIGTRIGPPLVHESPVRGAMFYDHERRILTWTRAGQVHKWDAPSGKQIGPIMQHDDPDDSWSVVLGARVSADGRRIVTWGSDSTARLWDELTGVQVAPAMAHRGIVHGAEFSADERRLLTWGDGTAQIWDTTTGLKIGPPLRHAGAGALFLPGDRRVLTDDGESLAVWDVHWAMRSGTDGAMITDACRDKFVGVSLESGTLMLPDANWVGFNARPTTVVASRGRPIGIRHLDAGDTDAAPILRDREGENVCAAP